MNFTTKKIFTANFIHIRNESVEFGKLVPKKKRFMLFCENATSHSKLRVKLYADFLWLCIRLGSSFLFRCFILGMSEIVRLSTGFIRRWNSNSSILNFKITHKHIVVQIPLISFHFISTLVPISILSVLLRDVWVCKSSHFFWKPNSNLSTSNNQNLIIS